MRTKQLGRDINLELWQASGWPMPENDYVAPRALENLARDLRVPVFQIVSDASLEVRFPRCETSEAFLSAYSEANRRDREILEEVLRDGSPNDERVWLEHPALRPLSSDIEAIVSEWIAFLRDELLFGPDDPPFPATKVAVGADGLFASAGLDRVGWRNARAIRRIFRSAFALAGLPYFIPHSFRKTLAALAKSSAGRRRNSRPGARTSPMKAC